MKSSTSPLHSPTRPLLIGSILIIVVLLMTTRISAISSSISRSLPLCYVRRRPPYTLTTLPQSRPCPLWSSSFSLCLLRKSTSLLLISPVRSFSSSAVSDRPRMTAAIDESLRDNPLLKDFDFPPFDCVQADHVRPGICALLNKLVSSVSNIYICIIILTYVVV